jgi:hypothetical protein
MAWRGLSNASVGHDAVFAAVIDLSVFRAPLCAAQIGDRPALLEAHMYRTRYPREISPQAKIGSSSRTSSVPARPCACSKEVTNRSKSVG